MLNETIRYIVVKTIAEDRMEISEDFISPSEALVRSRKQGGVVYKKIIKFEPFDVETYIENLKEKAKAINDELSTFDSVYRIKL